MSFLSLLISKEQKTSEFRQEWIDALRNEIALLIAHTNSIHGASVVLRLKPLADAWAASRDDYVAINRAAANIRLRLNTEEEESKAVLMSLEKLELLLAPGAGLEHQSIDAVEKQLVEDARLLLKNEWIRVRSGEPIFRISKWVFVAMIAISLATLIGYAAVIFLLS